MKSRSGYPYFPVYPDDFAADGKVEAMTTEQVGAYWLLLCKAWREEPVGSVPDDDPVLARWARLPLTRWTKMKLAVLKPWRFSNGRWHQKRMQKEYEKLVQKSEAARFAVSQRKDRQESHDVPTHNERNTDVQRTTYIPESESESEPDKGTKLLLLGGEANPKAPVEKRETADLVRTLSRSALRRMP